MRIVLPIGFFMLLIVYSCSDSKPETSNEELSSLKSRVAELEAEIKANELNLARFDSVDFEAWNKKDIALFNRLHDENVVLTCPDGKVEKGLKSHTAFAEYAFKTPAAFAKIKAHPIKVASNNWTAVIGINEMIQPDGSIKEVPMATFSKWKDGKMVEEHLFYTN